MIQPTCDKAECVSTAWQLESMKRRMMKRHSAISLKYRNSSSYYKKRAKAFELLCINRGIDTRGVSNEKKLLVDTTKEMGQQTGDSNGGTLAR